MDQRHASASADASPRGGVFFKRRFDAPCRVEVSHTFESLHAHLEFDDDIALEPGDEVLVHGAPIEAAYGEVVVERRIATVAKAGWIERTWTRWTGDIEFMELCEFSFSEEAKP